MKRLIASTIALLVGYLAGPGPVRAADLFSTKDGSSNLLPSGNWNGFYAEVGVGPGFVQSKLAGVITLSEKGTEFTGRLGYDYRFQGTRFGIGIYGDLSNAFDVNGSIGNFVKFGDQWSGSVGGKLSYDHGSGQIYVIGGPAWGGFNISGFGGSSNSTINGWKYGGGVNVKIVGPWYAGLELTQTDWGTFSPGGGFKVDNTDNAVRVFMGVTF